MRIRVTLQLPEETAVALNHNYALTAVAYRFLEYSDADYAHFLHGEGYAPQEGDRRRFKLFCFAPLRARRRRIAGGRLWLGPGEAEWIVSSPVEAFLTNFATGLLAEGSLRVGTTTLNVCSVETLPSPQLDVTTRFKCLSPIVAAVPEKNAEKSWTRYLYLAMEKVHNTL
jgi:CRISPR-associated endoribonuclease Cas6